MPFGVVSGVGLGMGVLDGGGDHRRGRAVLGVNLGRPTVTDGDFLRSCGRAARSFQITSVFLVVVCVTPSECLTTEQLQFHQQSEDLEYHRPVS